MEHLLAALLPQLPTLKEVVIWGGYVGLFAIVFSETGLLVGFFLPGDSLLVTAGLYAAATHELDPVKLIPVLIVAAIAGNATGYSIGVRAGQSLYRREQSRFFRKDHLIKTREFYEKYGAMTIVLAQFMPFARTFAPVVAGIGQMAYRRFALYNAAGAVAWITSMVLLGYFLGQSIPGIEHRIEYVIALVIFLSVLPLLIKVFRHRLNRKASGAP